MTRSGEHLQQIAASPSGAVAPNLPSSLAFIVHIEPPPHLYQPDFKGHRRKTNGVSELSGLPSPSPSTSTSSCTAASSNDAIAPADTPTPRRIPTSPRKDAVLARLDKRHTKNSQRTPTSDSRPKSVFEIRDQRLSRDWYNRSVTPTNPPSFEARHAPARTHIRQDRPNTAPFRYQRIPGSASFPAGISTSAQRPAPNRSVPTPLPLSAPLADTGVPSTRKPLVELSSATSKLISTRASYREEARETKLSAAMVGQDKESEEKKSAGSRLLIKGGQVVNDDAISTADVFVEDGVIKQVGPNLAVPGGARVIDVKGKYVFPGGIDTNTHFQLPFMGTTSIDDYYSGTKAALAGGTTTIIGTVLPQRGESLGSAYEKWRGWADAKACCDYGLSVAVTHWSDKVGDEIVQLASKGVNSFNFFLGYKDTYMLRDEELYRGFQYCKRIGAVARVHAENGDLVALRQKEILAAGVTGPEGHLQAHSEEAEIEATTRACIIARQANCPLYVLNITSKGAADAIGDAKRKGSIVVGETIAAALATDGHHYFDKSWRHAAGYVAVPPLRLDSTTPKYLVHLLSGGELHVSASAHRAYNSSQKAVGKDDFTKIPHGVNGTEERMMILWEKGVNNGKMDIMRFVAVTSTNAAKVFNIYPKKGRIAEGSDADIVIWDPESSKTLSANLHSSQSDFNIFEGLTCRGTPYITISGGKVVYEDGQLHVTEGAGKYVALPANSPHLFSSIATRDLALRPLRVDRDGPKSPVDNGSNNNTKAAPSPPLQRRSETYVEPLMPATSRKDEEFHNRPLTKAGSRNMQDSTFAISGSQADDDQAAKRSTRVSKPPGGESRGLW